MKILSKACLLLLGLMSSPIAAMNLSQRLKVADFKSGQRFFRDNRAEFVRVGIATGLSSAIVLTATNKNVQDFTSRHAKDTKKYIIHKTKKMKNEIKNLSTKSKIAIGTLTVGLIAATYYYFECPGVAIIKETTAKILKKLSLS